MPGGFLFAQVAREVFVVLLAVPVPLVGVPLAQRLELEVARLPGKRNTITKLLPLPRLHVVENLAPRGCLLGGGDGIDAALYGVDESPDAAAVAVRVLAQPAGALRFLHGAHMLDLLVELVAVEAAQPPLFLALTLAHLKRLGGMPFGQRLLDAARL